MPFPARPRPVSPATSELSLLSAVAGFEGDINVDPAGGISAAGSLNLKAGRHQTAGKCDRLDHTGMASGDGSRGRRNSRCRPCLHKHSSISNLNATLPFNSITGTATIAGDIKSPLIDGELNVKHLDLGWLATGMIMPVGGKTISAATTFDTSRLGWINQSLSISAQQVAILPGLALTNAGRQHNARQPGIGEFSALRETSGLTVRFQSRWQRETMAHISIYPANWTPHSHWPTCCRQRTVARQLAGECWLASGI